MIISNFFFVSSLSISRPYSVGLALLPFNKSVGFLLVDDPNGNFCDWREFLRRMAILSTMWVIPMYLAGRNTAEVVRCIHGDVSRYDPDEKNEKSNVFAIRRQNRDEDIDEEGVEIRQRAMACTVKYLFIFPLIVYITFNAIGALIEASEYAVYTTMEGDSFEITTGKQVCPINIFEHSFYVVVSLNSVLSCLHHIPSFT